MEENVRVDNAPEVSESTEYREDCTDAASKVEPNTSERGDTPPTVDYERLVEEDLRELAREFPEMQKSTLTDLKNPSRYGALRELGLTPREAYLASGARRARIDNRTHLTTSIPKERATGAGAEIPREELEIVRYIFSDMSDSELRELYRRVNS